MAIYIYIYIYRYGWPRDHGSGPSGSWRAGSADAAQHLPGPQEPDRHAEMTATQPSVRRKRRAATYFRDVGSLDKASEPADRALTHEY